MFIFLINLLQEDGSAPNMSEPIKVGKVIRYNHNNITYSDGC